MFWVELIIAVTFGLLVTLIFSLLFKRKGPWNTVLPFFLLISLGAWAGGVWLRPVGPAIYGYYWISFLIVAALIALIITVAGTTNKAEHKKKLEIKDDLKNEDKIERQQMAKMDLFFSSLIILLLLIITLGYLID